MTESRRRIAVLARTYPPRSGGIAAAHYNLSLCLRKSHDVTVFAFDDDDETETGEAERFKTHQWLGAGMTSVARMWVRWYAAGERSPNCQTIFRIIPSVRAMSRALARFKPDFILSPDNYVPALALRKPLGSKLLWIAHHNYRRFEGNCLAANPSWIDLQLAHRLELRGLRKADAVIAVSDYIAKVTSNTLQPTCPMHVIRNYVDTSHLVSLKPSDLRKRMKLMDDRPIVYMPSAGVKAKGERYTFEIVRRLGFGGRAAFFISGPLSSELELELERLDDSVVVHKPGRQDYDDNLRDVLACDFTVSPTLIENLSSALIESIAAQLPVVSFDVGGNNEIIVDGVNGFLVPYLDIEQLIERSGHLIDHRELRVKMRKSCPDSISALLDPDRVRSQYESVFNSFAKPCPN